MKRIFALLAVLCCLTALYGCVPAAQEPSAVPATAETAPAADPAAGLPLYLPSPDTARGTYNTGLAEKENTGLYFLDYASAENRILCSKPGCSHDSDACEGRFLSDESVRGVYALQDGAIVYGVSEGINGPTTLWLAESDGSERRELASIDRLGQVLCADAENIYVVQWMEEVERGYYGRVLRVSLADGAITPQAELPEGPPQYFLGVSGREVLAWQIQWEQIPPLNIPEDTTEEEARVLNDAYEEELNKTEAEHRVFLWSPDTGEQRNVTTWTSHYGSTGRTVLWDGGRLYWCSDNRPDDLHWMTPDGQTGELAVAWPEEILHSQGETIFYLERMLPGRLLLTVWGPWGIDRIQRYALDLESGAVQECPLEYVSNASERPIMILAQGEKELAVAFAEQRQQVEYIDTDGELATTEAVHTHTGVISFEDFLSGNPDYREITQEDGKTE